jgi:glucose-1-phosphate cytidylyltransferase
MSEQTVRTTPLPHIPVVIFCGGQGTRMRGGTLTKKELVEVGNRPILWHVMRIFSAYGFNHFVLPLGYGGDQIKRFFIDYEMISRDFTLHIGESSDIRFHSQSDHPAWRIDLIDTGQNTDKASRLARVAPFLNARRFFVTYGDGVGDVDLAALVRFHEWHGKPVTITAVQPGHYQYGTLSADTAGIVSEYNQYPPMPAWINAGFMLMERDVLGMIPPGDNAPLETDLFQRLVAEEQLMMYRHHGFWQSMDTLKDAMELEALWQQGAPWKVW